MVAVGKDVLLAWQVGAAGIDQIDARQVVLAGDLLCAQMFLHGDRIVGAALDRCVVGDDDAFAPLDAADAGDQPGRRHRLVVDPVGSELAELEERRADVEQRLDPVARQQLTAPKVALTRLLATALRGS